jgi:hypothetical protein
MQGMLGNPRSGKIAGHSPCRNERVPCKELVLAIQEYDSGRNRIPAWH